jgi:cytochrome P450
LAGKFFFTLGMRAKTRYDNGTLPNCFAKQLWDQREKHNLTDQEVGSLSGGLFGAGSDTSSATMTTFILACTVYGENFIKKAQEELDRVVGRDRSPTWTDEENLPYIRAVVKETFRWRPVAVLGGTPHANTEDDYYNGYFIPKGSTILGNLWAVSPPLVVGRC